MAKLYAKEYMRVLPTCEKDTLECPYAGVQEKCYPITFQNGHKNARKTFSGVTAPKSCETTK